MTIVNAAVVVAAAVGLLLLNFVYTDLKIPVSVPLMRDKAV